MNMLYSEPPYVLCLVAILPSKLIKRQQEWPVVPARPSRHHLVSPCAAGEGWLNLPLVPSIFPAWLQGPCIRELQLVGQWRFNLV